MNKKTGSKLEFLVAVIDENLSHSFVCVCGPEKKLELVEPAV